MARKRLTADGLVRLLPSRDAYRRKYNSLEDRIRSMRENQEDLRRLLNELDDVTEVFEGVPLEVLEATYTTVRNLGDGEQIRFASVAAAGEDEDGPCGPWVLSLGGSGLFDFKWGLYNDKAQALLAARRFCAKGVVPSDRLDDSEKMTAHG